MADRPDRVPRALADDASASCVCLQVRVASRRLVRFYESRLAHHGLGIAQFGLLASIAAAPGGAISALAARLELDPSTLSRTLRPLVAEGLAAIAADPENKRVRRVRLTDSGRQRLAAAGKAWRSAQAEAEAVFPPALVADLIRATEKLEM